MTTATANASSANAAKAPQTKLNHYTNDYTTQEGVRISLPLYIDLTTAQRKLLLNAVREVANATTEVNVHSLSGITVAHTNGGLSKVESYLGASLDVLRSGVLFQRGGIAADLLIRLQLATGVEIVSAKEIEAALKARISQVKAFVADNQFN
jgi:hypothetical protein